MFGSLITQPLRIATRSAQIALCGTVEIAEGLVGLVALKLIGRNGHQNGDGHPVEPAAPSAPAPNAPASPEPAEPTPPVASLFASTGHIDEETELVEEIADPGAEDGAGAEIRIAEPWDGYRTMKAADIIDRLATSSREELATVELHELAGRNRKSVVSAAQRALKQASPPRH